MRLSRLLIIGLLLVSHIHAQEKSAKPALLSRKELVQAAVKFIRLQPLTIHERSALKKAAFSGALVAAVAAITGLTSAYVKNRLATTKHEGEIPNQSYQFKPQTSIEAIARKYGEVIPIDSSPRALIVRGALGGSIETVRQLTDLVSENVLKIARDVAISEIDNDPDRNKTAVYREIEALLNRAIANFNESQFLKNIRFIRVAVMGLLAEVMRNICRDRVKPSKNALTEALEQLKGKMGTQFEEIRAFIKKPQCGI